MPPESATVFAAFVAQGCNWQEGWMEWQENALASTPPSGGSDEMNWNEDMPWSENMGPGGSTPGGASSLATTSTDTTTAVPEPTTMVVLASSLFALIGAARRRSRAK